MEKYTEECFKQKKENLKVKIKQVLEQDDTWTYFGCEIAVYDRVCKLLHC